VSKCKISITTELEGIPICGQMAMPHPIVLRGIAMAIKHFHQRPEGHGVEIHDKERNLIITIEEVKEVKPCKTSD